MQLEDPSTASRHLNLLPVAFKTAATADVGLRYSPAREGWQVLGESVIAVAVMQL